MRRMLEGLLADTVAAGTRLEVQVRRRVERQTAWVLHVYNLPTAGDMRRVLGQLSALDARVRDLTERLEEAERPARTTRPAATPKRRAAPAAKAKPKRRAA